jgi:wyosine [tRNA(Phe)-imidazoG37] synthetase (radical SAM superfamily)
VIPDRGFTYGPVPSRRLGLSLGVDVVPLNVCSYDCIYCQLGPTRRLSDERVEFFPVKDIVADVERRLGVWPPPDVITVAGSGEPTLYAGLGELIAAVKAMTRIPVALLTNGALFHRPDVRAEAALADLVLPSLDAGDEATFRLVNRPAPGLTLRKVVGGLAAFRAEYGSEIWLEVMVLAGINDAPEEIRRIAGLAGRVVPDRVQLNTAVRPTFDERAAPVPAQRLHELAARFSPPAEVIAEWAGRHRDENAAALPSADAILDLLRRRPCTAEQIAAGLHLHANEVLKTLGVWERVGAVHRVLRAGRVFWHAIAAPSGTTGSGRG